MGWVELARIETTGSSFSATPWNGLDKDSKLEGFHGGGFTGFKKIIANQAFRKHSLLVIFYYQMGTFS